MERELRYFRNGLRGRSLCPHPSSSGSHSAAIRQHLAGTGNYVAEGRRMAWKRKQGKGGAGASGRSHRLSDIARRAASLFYPGEALRCLYLSTEEKAERKEQSSAHHLNLSHTPVSSGRPKIGHRLDRSRLFRCKLICSVRNEAAMTGWRSLLRLP